jgi:hypothetical protein
MRRRRLHPQGGLDAAGERGEEGPGPDRLPKLQRPRQARPDRQVTLPHARNSPTTIYITLNSVPSMHAGSINPYESTIENAHE